MGETQPWDVGRSSKASQPETRPQGRDRPRLVLYMRQHSLHYWCVTTQTCIPGGTLPVWKLGWQLLCSAVLGTAGQHMCTENFRVPLGMLQKALNHLSAAGPASVCFLLSQTAPGVTANQAEWRVQPSWEKPGLPKATSTAHLFPACPSFLPLTAEHQQCRTVPQHRQLSTSQGNSTFITADGVQSLTSGRRGACPPSSAATTCVGLASHPLHCARAQSISGQGTILLHASALIWASRGVP